LKGKFVVLLLKTSAGHISSFAH